MKDLRSRLGEKKVLITGRIPELDGVRGFAILLVLVWHYLCHEECVYSSSTG